MKDIAKFIQTHKELNELPFLIVFRTIVILNNMGLLKTAEGDKNVGQI